MAFHQDQFETKHAANLFTESFEPQSYKEALESAHVDKWMSAFKE
jgi:hypothetical protein